MDIDGRRKLPILVTVTLVIALLHYVTPTEPHFYHKIHIVLRKLYFLPPVMAAVWFGLRGACLTASAVSLLFVLHAFLDWPGNYMEQANQVGELAGFWLAGVITGWLFDKQRMLLQELANANEETLLTLVSALDLREHSTKMHSQRVRDYTDLIARRLGVGEKIRREIGFGALLHDVGKIAVPDRILMKRGGLNGDEWQEMRKHPEAGYRIVKRIGFLKEAAEIVYSHHEHYDGNGYPRGLKGDEIPLGARIFALADVYDALTSLRSYKPTLSYADAISEMRKHKGSQFDPAILETFLSIAPAELNVISDRYQDQVEMDKLFPI